MRWGVVWLVVLCVGASAIGVGAARADATDTTAATTPATTTTTSGTTTSATTTPSYAELPPSALPVGCVGAGDVALVLPSHPVVTLGTPASGLGPSTYATAAGSVFSFDSASADDSKCKSAGVTLSSLSLFDGTVTASGVKAKDGKGAAEGLEINGSAVSATAGETVPVDGWGQLTLGAVVGRVKAPLVFRLLQAHDSLPAGTAIAVAFAASAKRTAKPKHHRQAHAQHKQASRSSPAREHSGQAQHAHRRQPPNFASSPYPFMVGDALAPAAQRNPVVSIAMKYLGVRYKWAGASPRTGFDCSGLVKYVFAQLGVSLPHYAAAQFYSPDAVKVAPDRLRAGDLVFFTGSDGTRKAPGHVGIYIGDGYLIDAPHTGRFVQIDNLNERWFANKYVGARRIVVGASHDARHLLDASSKDTAPAPAGPRIDPPLMTGEVFGESLPSIVAVPTAAHTSAPRAATGLWAGASLASVLLLLTGALVIRRRRRTPKAVTPLR